MIVDIAAGILLAYVLGCAIYIAFLLLTLPKPARVRKPVNARHLAFWTAIAAASLALAITTTTVNAQGLSLDDTYDPVAYNTDGLAELRDAVGDRVIVPDRPDLPPQCEASLPFWIEYFKTRGIGAFWTTNETGYFRRIDEYGGWPHRMNFLPSFEDSQLPTFDPGRDAQLAFWTDRYWLPGDGWQTEAYFLETTGLPPTPFEELLEQYLQDVFEALRRACKLD